MKRRIFSCLRICTLLLVALALGASCARSPDAPPTDESAAPSGPTGPAGVAMREDGAWKLYSPEGRTVLTVAVRDGNLCYCILTTKANGSVRDIHPRMPLVLTKEQVVPWLNQPAATADFLRMTPPLLERSSAENQLRLW